MSILARGDCPVGQLAEATGIGQSLASFHLGELAEAAIIRLERVGRFSYARLDGASVDGLLEEIREVVGPDHCPKGSEGAEDRASVREAIDRLRDPFDSIVGQDRVRRVVKEELDRLRRAAHAELSDILVQHASQRLRAIAQAEGRLSKAVPELLFVCVKNAGRSQIAAGLIELRAAGAVHAWSAGSRPARDVPPSIVQAMAEVGIDVSEAVPKALTNDLIRAADVVVTMGCGEDCPRFTGVRYLDWPVPDPADRPIGEVRSIRDDLEARVTGLLADVLGGAA